MKQETLDALKALRSQEKRGFEQTVDLVINLKKFDIKKESVNVAVSMPHKVKDYKMGAFLDNNSKFIDTIKRDDFKKMTDKKAVKNMIKKYDYFIAQASVMPDLAKTLGKYLGPTGKMPTPGRGVIINDDENTIKKELAKFQGSVKIKTKEPSIKLTVGKESMKDEEIAENVETIYKAIMPALPKGKENLRSILIKFTMSKPIKLPLN
jgi:large subunit ribosomal protein L1